MEQETDHTATLPCDCCGASAWTSAFTQHGLDLGRCGDCGLYYVAQSPQAEQRIAELESGHFADGQQVANAETHLRSEQLRRHDFQSYIDVARRFVPDGKWLDVGCGTGTLISLAQQEGIGIEGIELTADRGALAQRHTGAVIHTQPLEALCLPPASFAAVTMINVFSHLISPSESLAHVHRILAPGGVLLLRTGEIGPGARKHHARDWSLGDHFYFLGLDTIERYAERSGFELVHRDRKWQPALDYSRQRFRVKGKSRSRDFIKSAFLTVPGAFPLLRWAVLSKWQTDNPVFISTLVLKKIGE